MPSSTRCDAIPDATGAAAHLALRAGGQHILSWSPATGILRRTGGCEARGEASLGGFVADVVEC